MSTRGTLSLHNKAMLLWANPGIAALDRSQVSGIVTELSRQQDADGSWQLARLSDWPRRPGTGSAKPIGDAYATGLAVLGLLAAGVSPEDPRLARAIRWLRDTQDRRSGGWRFGGGHVSRAIYMSSIGPYLMGDLATAFAVLALEAHRDALRDVSDRS